MKWVLLVKGLKQKGKNSNENPTPCIRLVLPPLKGVLCWGGEAELGFGD